jgi:hypothetical protein
VKAAQGHLNEAITDARGLIGGAATKAAQAITAARNQLTTARADLNTNALQKATLATVQMHADGATAAAKTAQGHAGAANKVAVKDPTTALGHRADGIAAVTTANGHLADAKAADVGLTGQFAKDANKAINGAAHQIQVATKQLNTPALKKDLKAANPPGPHGGPPVNGMPGMSGGGGAGGAKKVAAPTGLAAVQMHIGDSENFSTQALNHGIDATTAGAMAAGHRQDGLTALQTAQTHLAGARAADKGLDKTDQTSARDLIQAAQDDIRAARLELNSPLARTGGVQPGGTIIRPAHGKNG